MSKKVILFWLVFVSAAGFRVADSLNQMQPDIGLCLKQRVIGSGIIMSDPTLAESGQAIIVKADSISRSDDDRSDEASHVPCVSGISIKMKTKLYPRFHYGDAVSFSGRLSAPFNFKGDTGRSFDYRGYLAKDDIFYEIRSADIEHGPDIADSQIDMNAADALSVSSVYRSITSALYKIKRGFVNNLNRALGEPHAALAAGLVVGEKSSLGKDLLDDFRTVGLIHIVVLSGFNITIVADALRKMLASLPRVWGIVVGGVGIVLFGVLVGGGATVIRSCFMALVALSANLIRRDYNVARALVFAGCLMLIQSPAILLHDPSFQLSFLATLGLILLASPIENMIGFIPDKLGLRGIVASTFATQIFVSPYILYMMGQISIIGVVVNILVLPLIPMTMLLVFFTGSFGFISYVVSRFFGWGTHLLLSYELWMVEHFARLPFAAVTLPPFSGWWVVGFYAAFAVVYAMVMWNRAY